MCLDLGLFVGAVLSHCEPCLRYSEPNFLSYTRKAPPLFSKDGAKVVGNNGNGLGVDFREFTMICRYVLCKNDYTAQN